MVVQTYSDQHSKGYSCIRINGEIDICNASSLKNQLLQLAASCNQNVLLDCSQLTYIDSQGLNALACIFNALRQSNRKLSLINTSTNIKKLLHIAEFDKVIQIGN